jgi:hypothetical protein
MWAKKSPLPAAEPAIVDNDLAKEFRIKAFVSPSRASAAAAVHPQDAMPLPKLAGVSREFAPHMRHGFPSGILRAEYDSLEGLERVATLYTGKHSVVDLCRDAASSGLVVVKTYNKGTMAARHFRNSAREVEIMRSLGDAGCPGVVRLLGVVEDTAAIALVQEACEGGDLFRRVLRRRGGRLDEEVVCREVMAPLLRTLAAIHERGIVHRWGLGGCCYCSVVRPNTSPII